MNIKISFLSISNDILSKSFEREKLLEKKLKDKQKVKISLKCLYKQIKLHFSNKKFIRSTNNMAGMVSCNLLEINY